MNGLTNPGAIIALQALLPAGTPRWLMLFTTLPGIDGTGGVEAAGSGYARVSNDSWTNQFDDPITRRFNSVDIAFPELTDDLLGIVGWGIATASSAGSILAAGNVLNGSGDPTVRDFADGDTPVLYAGTFVVSLA